MEERGRNYFDTTKDRGRYLNAGFHSLMGYFRDDQPLYELLLDDGQRKELDEMWMELDFVASATARMYVEYYSRRKGVKLVESPRTRSPTLPGPKTGRSRPRPGSSSSRTDSSPRPSGGDETGINAIKDYFRWINQTIRSVEKARIDAEPGHLDALLGFAARAVPSPVVARRQGGSPGLLPLVSRSKDGLGHEAAIRESIVGVLMSPDFCYRIDLLEADKGIHALSDHDLASRLSYFLWSSTPDEELTAHASAGDLHEPSVIVAQARRMLKDPRIRALAVEFGGNWLDFRRFERTRHRRSGTIPELQRRVARGDVRGTDSLLDGWFPEEPFGARPALRPRHVRQSPPWPRTTGCRSRTSGATNGCTSRTPTDMAAAASCRWPCSSPRTHRACARVP